MKHMSKLIREKRKKLKMSLKETAVATNSKAFQSITNWETEAQPIPLSRVADLMRALKITKKDMKEAYLLDAEAKFNKGTK